MAGRNPLPTKLKILTGNPGRRPINKNEPEPTAGIPSMPKWLKDFPGAMKEWKRESKILDGMGILTIAEAGNLAMRCYLASEIHALAADIKKEGRVMTSVVAVTDDGKEIYGEPKANPKAIQIKNLITEYRQIGSLLGLDPSSRTRLTVIEKGKKSKFSGLVGVVGGKKQ